jgi:hypothetical protein
MKLAARGLPLPPPMQLRTCTLYQLRTGAITTQRDPADWGMSCIYHFDHPLDLAPHRALEAMLVDLPVRLPPFYEIGDDYVIQVKAPYDGGYATSRYGEFLATGDCKPPPGFVLAHAQLLDRIIEHHDPRALHPHLVQPHSDLFYDDASDPPWTLYGPRLDRE